MLTKPVLFLVTVLTGVIGFSGLTGSASTIAQLTFFIDLVPLVALLVSNQRLQTTLRDEIDEITATTPPSF